MAVFALVEPVLASVTPSIRRELHAPRDDRANAHHEHLRESLQRYLQALWRDAPTIVFGAEPPYLAGALLQLPAVGATGAATGRTARTTVDAWRWYRAAAAHAAAHRAFSPPVFEGEPPVPITRALMGVLEDARVEALALRELPGLRRLWTPLHVATPDDGEGIESLMLRLARALLDPSYVDPHPWIDKGRRLFHADATSYTPALHRPQALRHAASLLGNDFGQMRLGFDVRGYRPGPDYRDDLRWMWASTIEGTVTRVAVPLDRSAGDPATTRPSQAPPETRASRHPEWDYLIDRLRHDWCTVLEDDVTDDATARPDGHGPVALDEPLTRRIVEALLVTRASRRSGTRRALDGEVVDLDAIVRSRIALRMGTPPDPRVFRAVTAHRARPGRALLVIDQSASSGSRWAGSTSTRLEASVRAARLIASAFERIGVATSISGFSSNGRHAAASRRVKRFHEPVDGALDRRLATLASHGSTRLGAALRHALAQLGPAHAGIDRQIVLISDGEPFDVDIHDPRYLVEDARHAVRQARLDGVRVNCLVLEAAEAPIAGRIFGDRGHGPLRTLGNLPWLAMRLGL